MVVGAPVVTVANNGYTFEDVAVSPGHGIIINDKSVIASDLINNDTIYQSDNYEIITYYHISFKYYCFYNDVLITVIIIIAIAISYYY